MTHPLARLLDGVTRYDLSDHGDAMLQKPLGDWVWYDDVLAALEAATPPDLVEAGKYSEILLGYSQGDMEGVMALISRQALHEAADTIRALIALATAQSAQIAGLEVYQKIAAEAERVAAYEKGRAEAAEAAAATLRAENERLRGASKALCDAVKADDGSNHHHFTISGLAKALLAALEAAP